MESPTTTTRERGDYTRRAFWANPDSYTSVLVLMLIDEYGTEALEWHPSTLKMQIEEDVNVAIPKENFDKLMAGITLLTTNYFYADVSRFIQLCNILAGDEFDPGVFDPADAAEIAWAITEVLLLDPPEEENPFSPEIIAYVQEVLKEEGFVTAPDVLKIGIDTNLSAAVSTEFADDPEMFQAIHENQLSKSKEIEEMLAANIEMLKIQLNHVPLKNGSTAKLLGKK